MTTIANASPPVAVQPSPALLTHPVTDADGDNDRSTASAASSPRGPATVTNLSPVAQAILNGQ